MSKVGKCRITTIGIMITFFLFVIIYSEYYLIRNEIYKNNTIRILSEFVLPSLVVLCVSVLLPTYILCITITPREIPPQYSLTTAEMAQFLLKPSYQDDYQTVAELTRQYMKNRPNLVVRERDFRHGGLRICEICCIIKPDRSHHCTICNRCIVRMDHHCHWVDNCIHGDNHKYFIQLITIALIATFLVFLNFMLNICTACTALPKPTEDLFVPCLMLYISCVFSGVVCLGLVFLTLDHCVNLFRGQTSYERIYDRDHYNRGWSNNFYQVMGTTVCEWVLPLVPSKLDSVYEPLLVTIEEPSSICEEYRRTSRSTRNLEDELPCNLEETISLNHGGGVSSPPSSRIRSPSTITELNPPSFPNYTT